MPEYSYVCEYCTNRFSLFFTIDNYQPNPKCIKCKHKCNRDYETDLATVNTSVKKSDCELKTIGDLAKRNADRMSEDQKHALYMKHNSYKDQKDLKPLPSGMSRVKKGPKIKWPGTSPKNKTRRKLK